MVLVEFVLGALIGALIGLQIPKMLNNWDRKIKERKALEKIRQQDYTYVLDSKNYDIEKDIRGEDPYAPIKKPSTHMSTDISTQKVPKKKIKKNGQRKKGKQKAGRKKD